MIPEELHNKMNKIFDIAERDNYQFITDEELDDFSKSLKQYIRKHSLMLYRYSIADYWNIRNFETGMLKLSPNGVMNDIFEGMPNDIAEHITDANREALRDVMYMKCFSEDWNNTLMWAHYANASQGMCVEYDLSLLDAETELFNHLFPVRYSNKRYLKSNLNYMAKSAKALVIAEAENVYFDMEEEGYWLKDIMSLFLSKGVEWSYEQEWRILVPKAFTSYSVCDHPVFEDLTIPFECATAVYCGTQMNRAVAKHIQEIAQVKSEKLNREIQVYNVKMSTDTYSLTI